MRQPRSLPMTAHAMKSEDEDDPQLFRTAVGSVRRAKPARHLPPVARVPEPRPLQTEADAREVMRELLSLEVDAELESGDTLAYRAAGVQEGVMRRLRRGHYRVEAETDLHGLNRDGALAEVLRFLAASRDRGHRCVRIIHGKGNGSPNSGPVIKTRLDGWLRKRSEVLAFCSARPADGGTGAVYVLLRSG